MNWELVTTLPPGTPSRTLLGRLAARFAVLRELEHGAAPVDHAVRGLVPLREVTVLGGKQYAVFDVVEAVTLREVLEAFGQLGRLPPLGLLARVVIDAARALSELSPALAHGGLSDSSLLVSFTGATSVMDFGAPRHSRFSLPGAPSFSNDVFSLTAVLHASLTSFAGTYADALADGLPFQQAAQLNPEVAPVLDDVLQRGLARAAEDRQPDVELLADELEAVLDESLFTSADIATVLGSMLAYRRQHLSGLLHGFGAATSSTMPQLGVAAPTGLQPAVVLIEEPPARDPEAADDRTGAHLVPWITEEQPSGEEQILETQPRIELKAPPFDPFQPIPMRTQPAAALPVPLDEPRENTQPRLQAPGESQDEGAAELGDSPLEATQPRAAIPFDPELEAADTGPRHGTPQPPALEANGSGGRDGTPPGLRARASAPGSGSLRGVAPAPGSPLPTPPALETEDTGPRHGAPQPPARRARGPGAAAEVGPLIDSVPPPPRRSHALLPVPPDSETGPDVGGVPPGRRSQSQSGVPDSGAPAPIRRSQSHPATSDGETGPVATGAPAPVRRSQAHAATSEGETGPATSGAPAPVRRSQSHAATSDGETGPVASGAPAPVRRSQAHAAAPDGDTAPVAGGAPAPGRRSQPQTTAPDGDTGPVASGARRSQAQAGPAAPPEPASDLTNQPTQPRATVPPGPRVLQSPRTARASRPDAPSSDALPVANARPSRATHAAQAGPAAPPVHLPQDTNEQLQPVAARPSAPQNTTESERLRARGQERIPTPPFGLAAIENEPTQTRRKLPLAPPPQSEPEEVFSSEVEAIGTSDSAGALPEPSEGSGALPPVVDEPEAETGTDVRPREALQAAEDDEAMATDERPRAPTRALRVIILLLLLVVSAMGIGIALKRKGLLPWPSPPPPQDAPASLLDAGEAEDPAPANEEPEAEAIDGGEPEAEVTVEAEGDVVVSPAEVKKPPAPAVAPKKAPPKKRKHR